jgi:hypothetical protein
MPRTSVGMDGITDMRASLRSELAGRPSIWRGQPTRFTAKPVVQAGRGSESEGPAAVLGPLTLTHCRKLIALGTARPFGMDLSCSQFLTISAWTSATLATWLCSQPKSSRRFQRCWPTLLDLSGQPLHQTPADRMTRPNDHPTEVARRRCTHVHCLRFPRRVDAPLIHVLFQEVAFEAPGERIRPSPDRETSSPRP